MTESMVLAMQQLLDKAREGYIPAPEGALGLADCQDLPALMAVARALRDRAHRTLVTYCRKLFIPLTPLGRDVAHYCTFAKAPKRVCQPYARVEQAVAQDREA